MMMITFGKMMYLLLQSLLV